MNIKYLLTDGNKWISTIYSLEQIEKGEALADIPEGFEVKARCTSTGAIAKDGREIFEGDVLYSEFVIPQEPVNAIGVVKFDEKESAFRVNEEGCGLVGMSEFPNRYVIGNINQEPKLLTANLG